MDERSPRESDSPDSPEDSGESAAYDARPENPYRIPQRPSRAAPGRSGDPRGNRSYPYDSEGSGTEGSSFLSSWDNPFRSADTPGETAEPSSTLGDLDKDGADDLETAPDTSQEPSFSAWSAPEGTPFEHGDEAKDPWQGITDLSESDRPEHVQDRAGDLTTDGTTSVPESSGSEPSQEPRSGWDLDPSPGAEEDPSVPRTGGRDVPDHGTDRPAETSWPEPEPGLRHSVSEEGTAQDPSRDRDTAEEESLPQETGHTWDDPSQDTSGTGHSWGPDTHTGSWEPPIPGPPQHGDDSTHTSGQEHGTTSQETPPSWDEPGGEQPDRAQAPSSVDEGHPGPHSPHPYKAPAQEDGTGAEAWETPPRDQPAHEEDTPYPGVVSFEGEQPDQRPGDGFEYLYNGGPAYSGSPPGPGDHGPDSHDPGPPPSGNKSRKGLLIAVASIVVVLAMIGGGVFWYVHTMPEPQEATTAYAAAWEAQDYESLAEVTTGDDAPEILGGIDSGLGVESIDVTIGEPTTDGGTGSASYEVTMSLVNADDWGWEGELPLVREDGEWLVDFSPETAYPGLGEGQVLARTAVWGERGHVLAADGTRLDGPDVSGSLQMIAGSLGEADEDDVERLGPAYNVGDTIGVEGLQRTYEERLAGEAATTILMVDAEEAEDPASLEATEENTVVSLDGSDGEDIVTSIDMDVQSAAASAVLDSDDPVGLVAVRPSTGEILAAANVPGGFNRAFEGQYPPGSAFKIITYSALLDNGLPVDGTMECPKEYELGGWPFRNAGNTEYGSQSVTEAFATSCNTALVAELGDRLSGEQLQASAEQFGMNQPLEIGVNAHEPIFPPVDSATMLGSQGIGQGQILTSPLHMATVPAAIADGSWRHPVLVTDPTDEELPEPAPVANAEALRPMMRAVITDGTAKDVGFEGEVFGKTGTAEFGTAEDADDDEELPSHAWMIGYKGDIAFAVVVDGGGGGSAVAGPLAAAFTNAL